MTLSRVDAVKAPRFPRSFRVRVFAYLMLLSATTTIAAAGIYYWRQLGFIEKDRARRARTLLTALATQAELGAYAGDASLCEVAARRTFSEEDVALVAIYDRHGREILHFSVAQLAVPPPPVSVLRRLLGDPGALLDVRPGEVFDDLYAPIVTGTRDPAEAIAMTPGGPPPRREVVGVARIGLSRTPAHEQLAEVLRWGLYLGMGLVAAGILAALFISRLISRPIADLKRGAEEVGAGNLDVRVDINFQDELGQLGFSFNRMASRLAETMAQLEALNRDLEAEVARRTLAVEQVARFTQLLNAPMGPRAMLDDEKAPLDGERERATLTLETLLEKALWALVGGTGARAGVALLSCEECMDFVLKPEATVGANPGPYVFPTEDELLRKDPILVTPDGADPYLVVPLVLGDEALGAVVLFSDASSKGFGPSDKIAFAAQAAAQLAIAVANARTYGALAHLAGELKERNTALAKQRDMLQEMNRLKSEFLANTSHELRTPLNAIIGYTELIADGIYGPVDEAQREALRGIEQSSRHLLAHINNLLDLSKVESGRMSLVAESVDVVALVEGVLAEVAPLVKERPYAVALDGPGHLVVETDAAKVKQIVTNLVSNAIKFTAQGRVDVLVRAADGGGCTIAVRDTGIGIRPEDQSLIFEEFRQVDGSTTRTYGGTGLGLAIARRLGELLGGRITVESRLGEGATFTLALPAKPPLIVVASSAARRQPTPPPLPRSLRGA